LIFSEEEFIQIFKNFCTPSPNSKHHGTKAPMDPSSSSRAFQRHQEQNLKHPGSVDLITTKQNKTKPNKIPFLHR